MPIKGAVHYAMRKMKGGGYERLAFNKAGHVIEAKNMDSGATHTPAEFAQDRRTALTRRVRGRR